jgi:hypothetical protein
VSVSDITETLEASGVNLALALDALSLQTLWPGLQEVLNSEIRNATLVAA